jgi:hypothetical protein
LHKLTQNEVLKGLNIQKIDFYLLDSIDSTNTFAKEKPLNKDYLIVISESKLLEEEGKAKIGIAQMLVTFI